MANVKVIFGSTTGATESAAAEIAAAFGVQAINIANATAADFQADLLILGSSTWCVGELQDDWAAKIGLLEQADLILYAGSLVPEELTHCAKQGAVVRSSAAMDLDARQKDPIDPIQESLRKRP